MDNAGSHDTQGEVMEVIEGFNVLVLSPTNVLNPKP